MNPPKVKDLLLARSLDQAKTAELLRPYGFRNVRAADHNLQAMADEPVARELLAELLDPLLSSIGESADPDSSLNHFERFAAASGNKLHLFTSLADRPWVLELLAKTFGASPFLSETLIRSPFYLPWVADPQVLNRRREKREMQLELCRSLRGVKTFQARADLLRVFRRKEILHIGIRDLLRLSTVEETNSALSLLAEVLIGAACSVCQSAMRREFGAPYHAHHSGALRHNGFSVIALGKLGGGELNFSSDVDLIYVYESGHGIVRRGSTEVPMDPAEYFERLSRKVTAALSDVTNEGYVYRVDLRLRPEGRSGKIAHSLDELSRYFESRGEPWERLAMIKAWPVAGDPKTGKKFLESACAFAYGKPFDVAALEQVKTIKDRIDRKIASRGQRSRNVKLGTGGIREIELIAQSLQVSFGNQRETLRNRSTLESLRSLFGEGLLSGDEHRALSEAYVFLRDVENKLQMVLDFQTHSIPSETEELRACAARLGYRDSPVVSALDGFTNDLKKHTDRVNRLFREFFYSSDSRLRPAE